ncbi:hypothetical protein ACP70R_003608 [Stipagrostis hirtigluma subsp. patula]
MIIGRVASESETKSRGCLLPNRTRKTHDVRCINVCAKKRPSISSYHWVEKNNITQYITHRAPFSSSSTIMEPVSQTQSVGDDYLSELPTEVLVSVLEKLDLRDAVRAGALSRRWRHLPHQLPRLVLDIVEFLGDDEYDVEDDDDEGGDEEQAEGPRDGLAGASDRMLEAATALLASRAAAGVPVNALSMRFVLSCRGKHHMSLGRLLDGAVAGGEVRAAELSIMTTCCSTVDDSNTRVFVGHGRRFRALFDGSPAAFGALTELAMEDMKLDKADLPAILTTCTRLEVLSLTNCDPGGGWWRVRHAQLKDIRIGYCIFHCVELAWLPKLERCSYKRWSFSSSSYQPLAFGHVPCLTTVTMTNGHTNVDVKTLRLSQILANTAVSNLGLNLWAENIWVKPEAPKRFIDMFRNLKHLKIRNVHEDCGLSWTYFFLQAAPVLKELYIKLWDHECERGLEVFPAKKSNVSWEVAAGFKHYSLTQLTILGLYSTRDGVVAYIRRVVEAAVNLKEIQICEKGPCKECGVASGLGFPRTAKEKSVLRESISDGGSVAVNIVCIQS